MINTKCLSPENLHRNVVKEGSNLERRFSVLLVFILFWVYMQLIPLMEPLSAPYLRVALQLKNASGILMAIVGTILYLKHLKLNRYATFPLIFSGFAFFSFSLSNFRYSTVSFNDLYLVLMYVLWSWVMFVLSPVVFDCQEKVKTFLKWAVIGTGLIFLVGLLWSVSLDLQIAQVFGGTRAGSERYSFGFRHVGYIGSILTSVVLGAMFLLMSSAHGRTRVVWITVSVLSTFVLLMTDSRSYIVLIAAVWITYLALNPRYCLWVLYFGGLGLIALLFWIDRTFLVAENPLQQINFYSSGRIYIWHTTIQNTMHSVTTILLGNGSLPGWTTTFQTISGDAVIKPFERFAADNIFVEIFSLFGVIGLSLFLWGIFRVIVAGIVQIRNSSSKQDSSSMSKLRLAIGVMVALLVSGITSSSMPSMGNSLNAVLLFVSVPIIINSTKENSVHKWNKWNKRKHKTIS
jgi:hypothetical protein